MNVIQHLRRRRPHELARFAEAVLLHLIVKVGLRIVSFPRVKASLERFSAIPRRTRSSVSDVTWAVGAAGRRLGRTTCLAEAIVVHTMLRRHGHVPLLRIGVRQTDKSLLEAHAWVECNGIVVMGEVPEIAGYAVLA